MKNTTYCDYDYFLMELILLAEEMMSDCYSGETCSEVIIWDFSIGIQRLREELLREEL